MMPATGVETRRNQWEKRVRRAAELAARMPQAVEILNFYQLTLEFQQKVSADVPSHDVSSQPEIALKERLDPGAVIAHLPDLLILVEKKGPSTLAKEAREVAAAGPDQQQALTKGFLSRNGDEEGSSRSFFALALLQPYAEALALTHPSRPPGSGGSRCPLCNSRPLAAVLRPEGDGGKRFLLCSLCLTEWEFRRVLCPVCGEEDYQKLPRYSAEDLIAVRVEACDTCHYYVKSVDLTVDGFAVPLVDEVAAASLDVWATEQGYKKAERNIMGF